VYIVGHCPVLASKRNRILGCVFWRPKNLKNVRVNCLISLVTNPRFGIVLASFNQGRVKITITKIRIYDGTT
jgi:hypothetical protein